MVGPRRHLRQLPTDPSSEDQCPLSWMRRGYGALGGPLATERIWSLAEWLVTLDEPALGGSGSATRAVPRPAYRRPMAPFDTAFARALAKDPKDRFPCCRDFARAITAAAAQSGVGFSPTAPTQEAPVPTVESAAAAAGRRPPALAIFAGAGLLGLVAAGVLLWAEHDGAPISTSTTTEPSTTAPPVTSNPPPPSTTPIPPAPKYPAAGALGEWCSTKDAIGTGPGGTLYYCSRLQYTDGYQWSLTPGVIPNELPPLDIPPGNPCMVPGSKADTVNGPLWCKPTIYGGWAWLPGGPA